MNDSEKREFSQLITATMKTYRVEADAEVIRVWWGVLSRYPMEQVRAGFSRFVSSKDSKFPPVPAHIVEAIEMASPDGRPGADEAWALYPHDEAQSAVITDEIAEAMQAAASLLDYGDRIGARMAFKDSYERIVARNKAAGIPVRWFPSLGTDHAGRDMAINQAVKAGRLSHDHAKSLLPAPEGAKNMQEVLQLADRSMSADQKERNRERMATIKAMLKGEVHVLPDSTDHETQLQRMGGK
jgi:hypothetical protein